MAAAGVTYWLWFFDRSQAMTALTVTELLECGRGSSHPLVRALRDDLRWRTGSSNPALPATEFLVGLGGWRRSGRR
jgi:hypothetical protein